MSRTIRAWFDVYRRSFDLMVERAPMLIAPMLVGAVVGGLLDAVGRTFAQVTAAPAPGWAPAWPLVFGLAAGAVEWLVLGWLLAACWAAATGSWPRVRRCLVAMAAVTAAQVMIGFFWIPMLELVVSWFTPVHISIGSRTGHRWMTFFAQSAFWLFPATVDARRMTGRSRGMRLAGSLLWALILAAPLPIYAVASAMVHPAEPWILVLAIVRRLVVMPLVVLSMVVAYLRVWPVEPLEAAAA